MVVDTSALLAILRNEPERRIFNEAIEAAEARLLSTASYVETSIVLESRYGAEGVRDLDHLIARAQITLEAVNVEQARLARDAFRKYGKGRHPAGLNFGDCFSYALSRSLDQPLLFKGSDFPRTDLECHEASRPGSD
ncbi:MAG: type II toxin-antitoxin system VapC family toxin [Steroidobacteraceae bacterium]